MSTRINDEQARREAIDPQRSFIVQAPAGSGKTELLTQRFLQLLCHTEKYPEEIIAITFTRKATAEMRQRILDALNAASQEPMPKEPHKQITWKLAKAALERDKKHHWQLQNNPNRLRIITIDALAAYLVKPMPNITENPEPYYREAVEHILLNCSQQAAWQSAIETLLIHLDNRVYLLEKLLIGILSKREQWLPHIITHQNHAKSLRQHMENALKNVILENIQSTATHLDDDILSELIPLADFAGQYCAQEDPENPITHCNKLKTLEITTDAFPIWFGIANLLLTQKGEWRKTITKRHGFPATHKDQKQQILSLLESLSNNDSLKKHLQEILESPPVSYNEQQWKIIDALIKILPVLAAQLDLLFMRDNTSDFVELNLSALRALGESENPSDLALHLDYKLKHLLIDEFQDTSLIQFQLIEKLLAGWETNDGRTIFLVGDPMQSIYRFRNAEVGLFLRAQQQGIANVSLQTLTLTSNFRSHADIVNWNNRNFQRIFPKESDITAGATPHSSACATKKEAGNVQWHPTYDNQEESQQVLQTIQTLQRNHPKENIAILVRSRSHLEHIVEALNKAHISFQAVDIEPLSEVMMIQDVHSLTRALLHRADRIAWLAILRAPFCGLTLKDLYVIAQASEKTTLWSTLKNFKTIGTLSEDAKTRLAFCVPLLHNTLENIGREPFSHSLRKLWEKLNAPEVENYFKLLEKLETQNKPLTLQAIQENLNSLYADPNPKADQSLQIMTIHKAKGLEFDHVLLPALHRKSANDKQQILKWLERPTLLGTSDLIMAPIKALEQTQDPIYRYLSRVEKIKADNERARLLYVATTRAKKSLHLFANIEKQNSSFLNLLWHEAEAFFPETQQQPLTEIDKPQVTHHLHRFKKSYFDAKQTPLMETMTTSQAPTIKIKTSTARALGIVIHEALENKGKMSPAQYNNRLRQLSVPKKDLEFCLEQIQTAINNTFQDTRGQWIFSLEHHDIHTEYALSYFEDNQLKKIVIDRCFIDKEGTRWIIDYKTGSTNPESLKAYQNQLKTYANVFQQFENRPIRLGLYFPLTNQWIE